MVISLKKTFTFGGVGDQIEVLKIPQKANILNAEGRLSGLGFNENIALFKWGTTVTTSSGDGTKAIDDQSDTYWEGDTSEEWMVLDFHSPATINGVIVPNGAQVADAFVWAGTTWLSFKALKQVMLYM